MAEQNTPPIACWCLRISTPDLLRVRERFLAAMPQLSAAAAQSQPLPLVVMLNCIEDTVLQEEGLNGVAKVEHVPLSRLAESRIELAAAVHIHSLSDLGLNRLVHVDVSRAEEVADTVMAVVLGFLRHTHLLSRHALSASGWLASVQRVCRGMRRCRGLVFGIVGRSDVQEGNDLVSRSSLRFPSAARRMDTLNDLLAASDHVFLHCALNNDTIQIINAECLQHIKPGPFLVNTGSSQLLDDCAVKQLLIDGTLAGCALDGAEGPQWMEAWLREMPNVLILPRSADYSEEVWMKIREKMISILQQFFIDNAIPSNAVSDEEEEEEIGLESKNEPSRMLDNEISFQGSVGEILTENELLVAESKETSSQHQSSVLSQSTSNRSETKRSRSSKKAKKRHGRQKTQNKADDALTYEKESSSYREDDATMSGTDLVLSSSSRFASPEDSRNRKTSVDSKAELTPELLLKSSIELIKKSGELLRDGYIVSLHARDRPALHVSRQRVQGGGWFLDTLSNVTKRDPAAQFMVVYRNKDTIWFRSFTAGGRLLLINRRMEFVFASHCFDVWECWTFEGSLEECRLVNCRNHLKCCGKRMSGTDQEQSEVVIEDTDKSKQEGGKRMSRTEEVKEQSDAKNMSAPAKKQKKEKEEKGEKKKMKEEKGKKKKMKKKKKKKKKKNKGGVEFCVPWTEAARLNPDQLDKKMANHPKQIVLHNITASGNGEATKDKSIIHQAFKDQRETLRDIWPCYLAYTYKLKTERFDDYRNSLYWQSQYTKHGGTWNLEEFIRTINDLHCDLEGWYLPTNEKKSLDYFRGKLPVTAKLCVLKAKDLQIGLFPQSDENVYFLCKIKCSIHKNTKKLCNWEGQNHMIFTDIESPSSGVPADSLIMVPYGTIDEIFAAAASDE